MRLLTVFSVLWVGGLAAPGYTEIMNNLNNLNNDLNVPGPDDTIAFTNKTNIDTENLEDNTPENSSTSELNYDNTQATHKVHMAGSTPASQPVANTTLTTNFASTQATVAPAMLYTTITANIQTNLNNSTDDAAKQNQSHILVHKAATSTNSSLDEVFTHTTHLTVFIDKLLKFMTDIQNQILGGFLLLCTACMISLKKIYSTGKDCFKRRTRRTRLIRVPHEDIEMF